MKFLLRELRPLFIYMLVGSAFTLLMVLATGGSSSTGTQATHWDEQDQMHQALDLIERDSLPE